MIEIASERALDNQETFSLMAVAIEVLRIHTVSASTFSNILPVSVYHVTIYDGVTPQPSTSTPDPTKRMPSFFLSFCIFTYIATEVYPIRMTQEQSTDPLPPRVPSTLKYSSSSLSCPPCVPHVSFLPPCLPSIHVLSKHNRAQRCCQSQ